MQGSLSAGQKATTWVLVGECFGEQTHTPSPAPDAELASTSVTTDTSGAVAIAVSCPTSESSCAGTVTLRTLGAVGARKKRGKAAVLMLAAGLFTVAGGRVETVMLHLSAKGRALLARSGDDRRARSGGGDAHDPDDRHAAGSQSQGQARPRLALIAAAVQYVANWSLWSDIKILLRTVLHVFARRGL